MKKAISYFIVLVLFVTALLSYPTVQADAKFKITATTSTQNSIKLKWTKAKGAKHYKIYRKIGNKFKFVKKVTKRTFADKKLKPNKKYTYKVRAFKKNKKGKFYSFKSATKTVKTKNNKQPQTTIPTTQTTVTTTQPTVSTTQTTSTTTTTTTQTETTTTVSTAQPTIPTQPATTIPKNYEELVKEARLRELHQNPDTAHATLDDIRVTSYYGTFNDCIVVMIWDNFTTVNWALEDVYVDGVVFHYTSSLRAVALKDGVLYQIQQAFDNGFLSHEDLQKIAKPFSRFCQDGCCS